MKKSAYHKTWPLIICFLLPIFIMAFYFAYRNMSPFGNQSILTVDLGQQYVDLFAYFRHTLLNDPSGIFYSFMKAFGGEMFGTWAYYLLSPVNLLLLFLPVSRLPAGVLIITLIKYGLSGLSFGYLLSHTIRPKSELTIMWSTIYALNGWIIANQLNMMWLDGMIWLPLVILGVNRIFNENHTATYVISMVMAIVTNYYMAYMIFLFTIIYIGAKLMASPLKIHQLKRDCYQVFISTFKIFGLTAWLTLPTLYSLIQGKAHYTHVHFNNHFEYLPIKMFSKLFNGSLDFNQLPHGLPNIFVGSVATISFIIYFCRTDFPIRKRISNFIVTLILILSLCYQPLDLLWHAGQFPIWYPYRFSYIFCFWIIWIAANAINGHYQINWVSSTIIASLIGILIVAVFVHLTDFPFIDPLNFVVGVLFLLIGFILLIYTHNNSTIFTVSLLILSICEMSLNTFNSLNNLSYISNASYTKYTRTLSKNVDWIDHHAKSPFRIGKTFYRSKDDPFSDYYFGGDTFDSSLESTTPRFMKNIGQPEGQGFATYTNGTLLSDNLLNCRYFITTNDHQFIKSNRPDLVNDPIVHSSNHFQIHKNSKALPLVFSTNSKVLHIKLTNNPINNQTRWYQAVTNQSHVKFQRSRFNTMHKSNLQIINHELRTENPLRPGNLFLNLSPKRHYAYYLLISPQINGKNFKVTQNNHSILPKSAYNHSIILSLVSGDSLKPVKLNFKLLQHKLKLTPVKLYRLNLNQIDQGLKNHSRVHLINNRQINGNFMATNKRSVLGTSIPATKGWHLTIDGRPHKIHKIAEEFIGAKVQPGHHRYQLTFTPPLINVGMILTLLTIIATVSELIVKKRVNKKDRP